MLLSVGDVDKQMPHMRPRWGCDIEAKPPRRGRRPLPGGHPCNKCDQNFPIVSELLAHKRMDHSKDKMEQDHMYPCLDCPTGERKVFTTKRAWLRHNRSQHINDMAYVCEQCGKVYYIESELERHMVEKHEPPGHRCKECGRYFSRFQTLKQHQDIHDPVPRYQCSECGTRFRTSATLRKHLQWHTGIRPHECPVCHRRFFRRNVMRAHLTTHTGTQPHVCAVCNARFAFRDSLQRHERTHTDARYRCTICRDKSFTRPYALKCHLMREHDIKLDSVTELDNNYFIVTNPQIRLGTIGDISNTNTSEALQNLANMDISSLGQNQFDFSAPQNTDPSLASMKQEDLTGIVPTMLANSVESITEDSTVGGITDVLQDGVESTTDHDNVLRVMNHTPKIVFGGRNSGDLSDINLDSIPWNMQT